MMWLTINVLMYLAAFTAFGIALTIDINDNYGKFIIYLQSSFILFCVAGISTMAAVLFDIFGG